MHLEHLLGAVEMGLEPLHHRSDGVEVLTEVLHETLQAGQLGTLVGGHDLPEVGKIVAGLNEPAVSDVVEQQLQRVVGPQELVTRSRRPSEQAERADVVRSGGSDVSAGPDGGYASRAGGRKGPVIETAPES